MKKSIILICISFVVLFSSCSIHHDWASGVKFQKPNQNVLPIDFVLQYDAGNGWYMYKSHLGYFLVSVQGARLGYSGSFVEMEYLGKTIDQ